MFQQKSVKEPITFKEFQQKTLKYQQEPIVESLSFKRNEHHIIEYRDQLCDHYKLNKSDLVKYLIKKEVNQIQNRNNPLAIIWKRKFILNTIEQQNW